MRFRKSIFTESADYFEHQRQGDAAMAHDEIEALANGRQHIERQAIDQEFPWIGPMLQLAI